MVSIKNTCHAIFAFCRHIFLAELNCVTETTTKLYISAAILCLHASARNILTRHFLKTQFNCSSMQLSNQQISRQQLSAFRQDDLLTFKHQNEKQS